MHAPGAGMVFILAMRYLMLLPALLLTGCAGLNPLMAGMSPDQIRATSRIKNAGVQCFAGTYAGARVNVLDIDVDKGIPAGVTIDSDCKATFSTMPSVTITK